jgi:hypothetical protein
VIPNSLTAKQGAVFLWIDEYRGDFKKCISPAIESTGLDIDDDWEKSPESP